MDAELLLQEPATVRGERAVSSQIAHRHRLGDVVQFLARDKRPVERYRV
jgi:hypothetical protein